jgi:hypothetical protein
MDKKGKATKDLTPFEKVRLELIDEQEDHPNDVLIALNKGLEPQRKTKIQRKPIKPRFSLGNAVGSRMQDLACPTLS